MPAVDREKAAEFLGGLKKDVRGLIEGNSNEATRLSVNSEDPHIPIIGCMQMALASAAFEYLITCGVKPEEALAKTVDMTGGAMEIWLGKFLKGNTTTQ